MKLRNRNKRSALLALCGALLLTSLNAWAQHPYPPPQGYPPPEAYQMPPPPPPPHYPPAVGALPPAVYDNLIYAAGLASSSKELRHTVAAVCDNPQSYMTTWQLRGLLVRISDRDDKYWALKRCLRNVSDLNQAPTVSLLDAFVSVKERARAEKIILKVTGRK